MEIEVYSDVVCPWCYIGERRLRRALEAAGAEDVEVVFRPYQLDPDAPAPGIPLTDYLERRYGAVSKAMRDRVSEVGAEEGIGFDWDAAVAANTFDAHRLLRLALEEHGPAVQRTLAEKLFEAHFERGRDVGDPQTLVALAGEAGINEAAARQHLAGGAGAQELREELDGARRMGIRAVPSFVFDGRYLVEGAQPPETLARVIARVREDAAA